MKESVSHVGVILFILFLDKGNLASAQCAGPPALCCLGENDGCYRGCYCDQACLMFGDCCSDYKQTCQLYLPTVMPPTPQTQPEGPVVIATDGINFSPLSTVLPLDVNKGLIFETAPVPDVFYDPLLFPATVKPLDVTDELTIETTPAPPPPPTTVQDTSTSPDVFYDPPLFPDTVIPLDDTKDLTFETSPAPPTTTTTTTTTPDVTYDQPFETTTTPTSPFPDTAGIPDVTGDLPFLFPTTPDTPDSSEEDNICFELNCTKDERCGEKDGVYGCFCKSHHPKKNHDVFDFMETCESSSGTLSLSRCQLFEAGYSPESLHLNDPNCKGTVQNGQVEFYFDNNGHVCGTSLMANGSHIVYENFVWGDVSPADHIISRSEILKLEFSCTYQQTQTLSLDINPLESVLNRILPAGQGTYQVHMISYLDHNFLKPFNSSTKVELDERVYVEVRVDGVDEDQFSTVIDSCWATPVNDPQYPLRWDLITDKCPSPHDSVDLLQNGISTSSRFSFSMFIFTANSTRVYIHCAMHLCLLENDNCPVHCGSDEDDDDHHHHHHHKRGAENYHDSASLSLGPLMLNENDIAQQFQFRQTGSGAPGVCGSLVMLIVSLVTVQRLFY